MPDISSMSNEELMSAIPTETLQKIASGGQIPPIGGEATSISTAPGLGRQAWNAYSNLQRMRNNAALGMVRGITAPIYSTAARMVMPEAPPEGRDLPYPQALGGAVKQYPGAKATLGDLAQVGAMAIPMTSVGRAALAAMPVRGAAALGGAMMGGQAASEDKSGLSIAGHTVLGAGIGGLIGQVTKPGGLKAINDYIAPRDKASAVSEEMAGLQKNISEMELEKRTVERGLRGEVASLGTKKTAIGTELAGKAKAGTLEIQKLDSQLADAAEKSVPQAKQQVLEVSKKMTTAYGEVLSKAESDLAATGQALDRADYRARVIQPVLDEMQEQNVPVNSRIYKAIDNVAAPVEVTEGQTAEDVLQPALTFKELPRFRKSVFDAISGPAKEGTRIMDMDERWANEFRKLHGAYIAEYSPELAEANQAYRSMATVRKWLVKRTQPYTSEEMDGTIKLLTDLHSGNLTPTAKTMIRLAEEGKGPIPGLGRGSFGKATQSEFENVSGQKQAFKTVYDQVASQLGNERDTLKRQILNIQSRLKDIQVERADTAMSNEAMDKVRVNIRELDIKRKRLIKISNWERSLFLVGAGIYINKNELGPIARHAMAMP